MYLVFARMPGESDRRRLKSLLCLCDVLISTANQLHRVLIPKIFLLNFTGFFFFFFFLIIYFIFTI